MVSKGFKTAGKIGLFAIGGLAILSLFSGKKEESVAGGGGGLFSFGDLRESAGGTTSPTGETFDIVPIFSNSLEPATASANISSVGTSSSGRTLTGTSTATKGGFSGVVFRDSSGKIAGVEEQTSSGGVSRIATPIERITGKPQKTIKPSDIFKKSTSLRDGLGYSSAF